MMFAFLFDCSALLVMTLNVVTCGLTQNQQYLKYSRNNEIVKLQ